MLFSRGIGGKHPHFFYKALWDQLIKQFKVVSERRMSTPIKQPKCPFYGPKKSNLCTKIATRLQWHSIWNQRSTNRSPLGNHSMKLHLWTFICSTRTWAQFDFPSSRKRLVYNNNNNSSSSYASSGSWLGPTLSKSSSPARWAEPREHIFRWLLRLFWVPKPFPQQRQTKARSLECTDRRCRFKSVLSRNSLAQWGHCIFLQWQWMVFSCRSMLDFRVKLAGHLEHWKRPSWPAVRPGWEQPSGSSMEKVCSWMCSCSSSARWNTLLQKPQVSLLARAESRKVPSEVMSASSDLGKLESETGSWVETHGSVSSGIK